MRHDLTPSKSVNRVPPKPKHEKRAEKRTPSNHFSPPPRLTPPGRTLSNSRPFTILLNTSRFSFSLPSNSPTPPNSVLNGSTCRIASSVFICRKLSVLDRINSGKLDRFARLARMRPSVEYGGGGEDERRARMASRKGTGGTCAAARDFWSQSEGDLAFQRGSEAGRSMASSAKGRSGAVSKVVAVSRSER